MCIRDSFDAPDDFWPALDQFLKYFETDYQEIEQLILENEIVMVRTRGVSVLPLFVAGWAVFSFRDLILRNELMAQFYLGTAAGALVPLLQAWLLQLVGSNPLMGWQMGAWCLANALLCGVAVPVFDRLAKLLDRWLSHPVHDLNRWPNANRQIVRGKN